MANSNNRGFNTIRNSRVDGRQKNETLQLYTMIGVLGMAVLTVALLVIMGIGGLVGRSDNNSNKPSGEKVEWGSFTVTSSETLQGTLMLVNNSHAYTFPSTNDHLGKIYDKWKPNPNQPSQPYVLSGISVYMDKEALNALDRMLVDFYNATGKDNVQLRDAYRTLQEQEGKSILPGYSDHHTGLGCALRYEKNQVGYDLSLDEVYNWLFENCYKYGFVIRYPDSKADITGVSDYNYYFRYVGIPHATYMAQNDLCMEEYVELLKGYTNEKPLKVTAEGKSYEIYYVAVDGSATVKYPTNYTYEVSGTNEGGVVITVDRSSAGQGADTSADTTQTDTSAAQP